MVLDNRQLASWAGYVGSPATTDTLCHKAIALFSLRVFPSLTHLFARTVQIQKTWLKCTQKSRLDGMEVPFSTDSLDVDRSKAKSNLTHPRQER